MEDPTIEEKPIPVSGADRYKRRGQLCEILSVLAITAGVALVIHGFLISPTSLGEGIAGVILIVAAAVLFILAVWYAARVDNEEKRFTEESFYLISSYRIGTLREVKAPEDVTTFLKSMEDDYQPVSQVELLSRLKKALGTERTREVKDIVLRYTRVDAR